MATKVSYKDILSKVVKNWIICYGAITLQVVAGYWVNHIWMPYVGLLLIGLIVYLGNLTLRHSSTNCSIMPRHTVYILLISGLIMLVLNVLNTNFITNKYSEFSHQDYPFHAIFIVYPVAVVLFGIAILRRGKPEYCKACRMMSTYSIKESLRRNVLHHETKFQLKFSFFLSLFLCVVAYAYYFVFYSKYTFGRRHSPDVFFMYVFPAALYLVSVLYMIMRYSSLEFEISLRMSQELDSRSSKLRYMVVWRDKLLLSDIEMDGMPAGYWDTPAEKLIPFQENMSEHQAKNVFRDLFGGDRFSLKRLFCSSVHEQNVFHYAAFIDDAVERGQGDLPGEWLNLKEIDFMLHAGMVSRAFAAEMHRVFTITMAWKTYDREGRRLYPIKNYRPTFRLRDFNSWDVDYEDMHWMSVSENNQDKPFYQLRKFWRKYINGIDSRWDRTNS